MIVALVCLAGTNAALAAALAFVLRQTAAERARLVNAVLARNPAEFAQLQNAERPRPAKTNAEPRPVQVGS